MTRFIFLRKGPHSPGPLNFCRDAAIETVAQAAERDCAGVSKNLDTLAHLGYASDTLARPQLYRPGLAHGWRSVALVPFWGGTAEASGGNSHSRAKRNAKIRQAAGTVCSALKPFHRAAVGVCGPEDRNLLLEALQGRWGIGPAAAVRLPRMPIDRALELISDKLLVRFKGAGSLLQMQLCPFYKSSNLSLSLSLLTLVRLLLFNTSCKT